MRILFGTTNPAKLAAMREVTDPLGIELIGLRELGRPIPVVEENGKDPLENACLKAEAFYKAFSMPVFSCDSGLYFDGLEDALQPGTHIKRVNGVELTDAGMTEYYAGLARRCHDRLIGRYRNAICFIREDGVRFCSMDESLATEPFLLVSRPHPKRVPGFPLDSLSVDIASGKYYYDLPEKSLARTSLDPGFRLFFEKTLGR